MTRATLEQADCSVSMQKNDNLAWGWMELDLLAAGINETTGTNWGGMVLDAMKTPGACRVKLNFTAGGEYVSLMAQANGSIAMSGDGQPGEITDGLLTLWGRLPAADASDVRYAIDLAREAEGLSPLFKCDNWRLVACGMDNIGVDWGCIRPHPPCWWVAKRDL